MQFQVRKLYRPRGKNCFNKKEQKKRNVRIDLKIKVKNLKDGWVWLIVHLAQLGFQPDSKKWIEVESLFIMYMVVCNTGSAFYRRVGTAMAIMILMGALAPL